LPAAVKTADLNADGKTDVIVQSLGDPAITVYFGKGDGTLQGKTTYAINTPEDIAIGDFNRDGKPDLAIPDNIDGTIGLFFNGAP
jgi:hypothetical protein